MQIGWCGCSYTVGVGLRPDESSYCELVQPGSTVYARSGASNHEIFEQACQSLTENDITVAMWTSPGRNTWVPQWDHMLTTNSDEHGWSVITEKRFNQFVDVYKIIETDYDAAHKVAGYVEKLHKLSKQLGRTMLHLNAMFYVDDVFLNRDSVNFADLSQRTQHMLALHELPDSDVELALDSVRDYYETIKSADWIDINQKQVLDVGYDGSHMGPKSHRLLADKVLNYMQVRGIYE